MDTKIVRQKQGTVQISQDLIGRQSAAFLKVIIQQICLFETI